MTAPRIIQAVATAVGRHDSQSDLTRAIEAAMTAAVEQALADGVPIDDTDEILRRKAVAHDQVLEAFGG